MKHTYDAEITVYSEKIPGEKRNYYWAVRFDNTGLEEYAHEEGFIGITQFDEHGNVKERVLLSPAQVRAFVKFSGTYRHLVTAGAAHPPQGSDSK